MGLLTRATENRNDQVDQWCTCGSCDHRGDDMWRGWERERAATSQWTLKALFFLILSPIKFMFERSDFGPNFFNHV
jgi:hypothetical protein